MTEYSDLYDKWVDRFGEDPNVLVELMPANDRHDMLYSIIDMVMGQRGRYPREADIIVAGYVMDTVIRTIKFYADKMATQELRNL